MIAGGQAGRNDFWMNQDRTRKTRPSWNLSSGRGGHWNLWDIQFLASGV